MHSSDVIHVDSLSYSEWRNASFDVARACPDLDLDLEFECNEPSVLCLYCRDLFRNCKSELPMLADEPREKLLYWMARSYGYLGILNDPRLIEEERRNCIESMYFLFSEWFVRHPEGYTCFMWWDLVGWLDYNPTSSVLREETIVNVVLNLLRRIIDLPSRECIFSGLHGFGHFWNPERSSRIEELLAGVTFVDESGGPDVKLMEYMRRAIVGDVE
jgi:hypothetical protein